MPQPADSIIDVVAAIIWRDGAVLAVERPEGKPQAGRWEFPGGKVEAGESLEQALDRELGEELGIAPRRVILWREAEHAYKHIHVRLHFFHVFAFNGEPQPLEGHHMEWLAPADAGNFPFLEADAGIVEDLCTYIPPREYPCAS